MATPTHKNKGIDDLLASIIDEAGVADGEPNVRRTSIENDVCVFCKGPADTFKDDLSKREFSISGICQNCQDEVFG